MATFGVYPDAECHRLSLTETPETVVSPKAEMAAEVARRVALLNPAASPVAPAVKDSVPPSEAPKTASDTVDKVGAGAAATPTSPATPPAVVAGQDVGFVPEKFRSFVEKTDAEFVAWLRENHLRTSDYTKKTMAVAEDRKQLEKAKGYAEYGEAIFADPRLRRLVEDAMEAEKAPKPTQAFDYLSATPEEIEAHEVEREERAARKALAVLRSEQQAQSSQHQALTAIANAAHAEFVKTGEYADADVNAAYDKLEAAGVKFSPDNVVEALRWVLPKKAPPAPQASPPVTAPAPSATSGASALTRGAGVSAPVTVPPWMRENRPPSNQKEWLEAAVYRANQKRIAEGMKPLSI